MKKFIKKNKKLLIVLVVALLALTAGIILVRQNQDMREDASGLGCKDNTSAAQCRSACSQKIGTGKNNLAYHCRWTKDGKCVKTNKKCDMKDEYLADYCLPTSSCDFSGNYVYGGATCLTKSQNKKIYCCYNGRKYDKKTQSCILP